MDLSIRNHAGDLIAHGDNGGDGLLFITHLEALPTRWEELLDHSGDWTHDSLRLIVRLPQDPTSRSSNRIQIDELQQHVDLGGQPSAGAVLFQGAITEMVDLP